MKKKIVLVILLTMVLLVSIASFGACEDDLGYSAKEVVLELVNPNTGEAVKRDEVIELPRENTPIEVRIKDKETGKYLTDYDLPENTIKGSYHLNLYRLVKNPTIDVYDRSPMSSSDYWPIEEDNVIYNSYYYEIVIFFDCRPENPSNPQEFQRKYKSCSKSVRFYSSNNLKYSNMINMS